MTWFSLICLLALTSSAVGRSISAYGGYDLGSQAPVLPLSGFQSLIPRTILPTNTLASQAYGQTVLPQRFLMSAPIVDTSSYQQQLPQQPIQQSYGVQMTLPRTLPMQSYAPLSQGAYGAVSMTPQLDVPPPVPVLSQADVLCQGRQAEEIIPIENNRKFVICLDSGKGVEQQCPAGLFFHSESRRCERTSGPLEDACLSQPCLNGGQCLSSGSSFQCQCAAGFEGVFCELDARICQTQQPCGTSSDAKCQSFRLGAALSYICIFQNGLSYGLNAQQTILNPCQGTDGPQALAVSRNGFIMCDAERLFVESCPGGTIWDDVEKACSWPDQQTALQESRTLSSGYGYGSSQMISQQQPVQSYGSQTTIPQQQPIQSYGSPTVIPQQQPIQSYGSRTIVPQQQPVQSYGSQTLIPQQTQTIIPKQFSVLTQSYGSQTTIPQQQPVQSYGSQTIIPQQQPTVIAVKQLLQPMQSYGAQTTFPQQQPTLVVAKQLLQPMQSYGAQAPLPQQQQPTVVAPKQLLQPMQSYGAQTTLPQQQPTMIVAKQLLQPMQSYGAQAPLPQQQPTVVAPKQLLQPVQSYGAQAPLPQQQPTVVAPKQLLQPTQSYGATVQVSQAQPTMSVQQDVLTLQPGKPYGAAEFPTSHKS